MSHCWQTHLDLIDFFLPVKFLADIVRILIDKKVDTFSLKDADWSGLAVTDPDFKSQ